MEVATLRAKHAALAPVLTERSRRVWAATEAQAIGYGGTARVARATGIATSTIQRGLRELTADEPLAGGRTRRAGGGRMTGFGGTLTGHDLEHVTTYAVPSA